MPASPPDVTKGRFPRRGQAWVARMASVVAVALVPIVVPVPAAQAAPRQISYVVAPHPDDEYQMWSLIEHSSDNYKVVLVMTQGEESGYCQSAAQIAASGVRQGAYGYQGANSPVGQPDLGEVHPGNPWAGKWTSSCTLARRQSTIRFWNARADRDGAVPRFSDSSSTMTLSSSTYGTPSDGEPTRRDDGTFYSSRSVRIHAATNGMGRLIFFHLGDQDLRATEVTWALNAVRDNKAAFGLPNLPDYNVLGAFANDRYGSCDFYNHPDHMAVHSALRSYAWSGPQLGRTCPTDPYRSKFAEVDTAVHDENFGLGVNNFRSGIFQHHFGWLALDHWGYPGRGAAYDRQQDFWSR